MTTYYGTTFSFSGTNATPSQTQVNTWLLKIKQALTGSGLVQTGDTGQLDPDNVTNYAWPTFNSDIGYFIYRFNDSRQGVDPIYLKVMPGHGDSVLGTTRIRLIVGQGSNGSGTITGQLSSTLVCGDIGIAPDGNAIANQSEYSTHSEGHAAFFDRVMADYHYRTYSSMFSVSRTRDNAGAFDGGGVFILSAIGSSLHAMQSVRYTATATTYSNNYNFCVVPGEPSSTSLLNGDRQLYPHFSNFPDIRQAWATFTIRQNEISALPTTFTAAPYLGVTRQFISMGSGGGYPRGAHIQAANNVNFIPAVLWED